MHIGIGWSPQSFPKKERGSGLVTFDGHHTTLQPPRAGCVQVATSAPAHVPGQRGEWVHVWWVRAPPIVPWVSPPVWSGATSRLSLALGLVLLSKVRFVAGLSKTKVDVAKETASNHTAM